MFALSRLKRVTDWLREPESPGTPSRLTSIGGLALATVLTVGLIVAEKRLREQEAERYDYFIESPYIMRIDLETGGEEQYGRLPNECIEPCSSASRQTTPDYVCLDCLDYAVSRDRPDWMEQVNPHDVMVELKQIETEIRSALEDRDPKRKRKFAGTRRWLELEDDIISWRFSGRFDEEMLTLLQRLISRRHYLVRHLRFLSGTRPVWNS